MQISLWSNMHGQGATSATTAALASVLAQRTNYKILVTHNHVERSALEGYFYKPSKEAELSFSGLANQGLDALIRLIQNGRLSPDMVPDYTYSLLKNNGLDILMGTSKNEYSGNNDCFMDIIACAKRFYDIIITDVHSGLEGTSSLKVLENSDVIIYCLNQNRFLLEDFKATLENHPILESKHAAYVISRYESKSSMTPGNISRRFQIDRKAIFVVPENSYFMDALNNGKVFEFSAYYKNARKGAEKDFIASITSLADYVIKGCTK